MQSVILIGGKGTRLRPFTSDTPKPLLPLINRPFLEYQFDILRKHGIREAILCTSYRTKDFKSVLGTRSGSLKLTYVPETRPLGTAGALKNAERHIKGTVLVLNGDILNHLDITGFLANHKKNRAEASIALTRVKDPTIYGLVETGKSGLIAKFLEKPSWDEIETNTINAGAYLFEPGLLGLIPKGVTYSLERSLFPQLLHEGRRFFGFVSPGYWMDIGTIEKYLQAHIDILSGAAPFRPKGRLKAGIWTGKGVRLGRELSFPADSGNLVLGDKTVVGDFARFSGRVCVAPHCVIGKGALLEDSVILEGTRVGEGATLRRCVIGPRCRLGANSSLAGAALAGGSTLGAFSNLAG